MSGSAEGGGSGWFKWLACGCGGCLALVLLVVGFVTLVGGGVMFTMRQNEAYRTAVERATEDPRVIEALGEPLDTGWFTTGSFHVSNDSGSATLVIPISGPEGSGQIEVDAIMSGGVWEMRVLTVFVETTGETIDLLKSPSDHEQLPDAGTGSEATEAAARAIAGLRAPDLQPSRT